MGIGRWCLFLLAIIVLANVGCARREKVEGGWRGSLSASDMALAPATGTGPRVAVQDLATNKAVVTSVDTDRRIVGLRGMDNRVYAVYAGNEVANLGDLRVGDTVLAKHYQQLVSSVLRPGDQALESGVATFAGKGMQGEKPEGVAGSTLTMTAQVETVDRTKNILVIRNPAGELSVIESSRPEFTQYLSQLNVGDNITVAYTEGALISVERL